MKRFARLGVASYQKQDISELEPDVCFFFEGGIFFFDGGIAAVPPAVDAVPAEEFETVAVGRDGFVVGEDGRPRSPATCR